MACSIEMLPCDGCGREIERYNIYLVKDSEGQRHYLCPECAGVEAAPTPPSAAPDCDA